MSNEIAFRRTLSAIVEEYNAKVEAIPSAIAAFNAAGDALKSAATISGTWRVARDPADNRAGPLEGQGKL